MVEQPGPRVRPEGVGRAWGDPEGRRLLPRQSAEEPELHQSSSLGRHSIQPVDGFINRQDVLRRGIGQNKADSMRVKCHPEVAHKMPPAQGH